MSKGYISKANLVILRGRGNESQLIPTTFSAIMNAIAAFFGPHVIVKCCFFHLCQSTWRKIQTLGLSQQYMDYDDIKLFCGMLDRLAFLPLELIQDGLQIINEIVPPAFAPLVEYFDATYVTGTFRRIARPGQNVLLRNIPPLFLHEIWNVYDTTIQDGAHTNNLCEAWNSAFNSLVGYKNASIWACIEGLRKDVMMARTHLRNLRQGIPLTKRVHKKSVELQTRLKTLRISLRDENVPLEDFMRGIGHNIRCKM